MSSGKSLSPFCLFRSSFEYLLILLCLKQVYWIKNNCDTGQHSQFLRCFGNREEDKEEEEEDNKEEEDDDTIPSLHCCVGHTAWAPEGREGRYQAGPEGRNLEVGARRAPRLLVLNKTFEKTLIVW